MKILVIEDEPELRKLIKRFLEEEHYIIEEALGFHSGQSTLYLALRERYCAQIKK